MDPSTRFVSAQGSWQGYRSVSWLPKLQNPQDVFTAAERERLAQAWMSNEERFSKLIARDKELVSVELDPFLEIPDVDRSNDAFPRRIMAPEPLRLMRTPPRMPNSHARKGQAEGEWTQARS